ncbi:MAG: hypothetical protein MK077_07650 [Phycisphaerales bacterium]|nr:hypothetical protein [Phycisphaerales bacterium]
MLNRIRIGVQSSVLLVVLSLCLAGRANAETPMPVLLDDFIHYSLTAQVELAKANGEALLGGGLSDADLASYIDDDPQLADRLLLALRWAREVPDLEPIAAAIESHVEKGRLDLARDQARINEAITMLDGTRRARMLAHERLLAAGEQAVPAMLVSLANPETDSATKLSLRQTLPALGREAVAPLAVALPHLGEQEQLVAIATLGDIGYPHAAPALVTLIRQDDTKAMVHQAALQTLERLGYTNPREVNLADLESALALEYLQEMGHLQANPVMVRLADGTIENRQNIWQWSPELGLSAVSVSEDLYWPVMAIRHADTARKSAPESREARATFVAGNLRLENRLGDQEEVLPLPDAEYSPNFHATIHGPAVARDVLLIAIDQDDRALARDALAALGRTGGAETLVSGEVREPVTEALMHSDRSIQYDAALVVARAMPAYPFPGSNRVVPLLGAAVNGGTGVRAAVLAPEGDRRWSAVERLQRLGFDVASSDEDLAQLATSGNASGFDLIYLDSSTASLSGDDLVSAAAALGVPTVVVVSEAQLNESRANFETIPAAAPLLAGADDAALVSVIESLQVGDRMDEAQVGAYSRDALQALRDLAQVRPGGLNVSDALPAMIEAFNASSGGRQLVIADVLASIDQGDAQRALINGALRSTDGSQQISLMDFAASSVRRFGDLATDRQAADLKRFLTTARGQVAEAAARLYGSMNRHGGTQSSPTATTKAGS